MKASDDLYLAFRACRFDSCRKRKIKIFLMKEVWEFQGQNNSVTNIYWPVFLFFTSKHSLFEETQSSMLTSARVLPKYRRFLRVNNRRDSCGIIIQKKKKTALAVFFSFYQFTFFFDFVLLKMSADFLLLYCEKSRWSTD